MKHFSLAISDWLAGIITRQTTYYARLGRSYTSLGWLFSPSQDAFFYAARTTFAALVALVIALWMELDSPQWAPMTVWIVAQGTRGETLSKAKWRIYGTIIGTIGGIAMIALFPQEWGLFILALALWMGLSSTLATFTDNFRAYGLVLAGYTTATIAVDAISNPNNAFIIGMSRFTYIVLGVVVETAVSAMFSYNLVEEARTKLNRLLHSALEGASLAIADLLAGDKEALGRLRLLFSTIVGMSNQIEFHEIEMGHHGHEGDHARAALSSVSILLSRALGLAARLKVLNTTSKDIENLLAQTRTFFSTLPTALWQPDIAPVLKEIHRFRAECRRNIIDILGQEIENNKDPHFVVDHITTGNALHYLNERIIYQALADIYSELEQAISEYDASQHPAPKDHFHFKSVSFHDPKEALYNGIRSASFVVITGLIWEVTAWSNYSTMMTIGALTVGRFSTSVDSAALTTYRFFQGSVIAVFVAFILNFLLLPTPQSAEILALCLSVPMFVAGLASRDVKTAPYAIPFNIFLPALIGPSNMGRINEVAFFNSSLGTLAGIWLAVTTFKLVLPFDPMRERWRLRYITLQDLRHLATVTPITPLPVWVGRNVERFVRLIRHSGPLPTPVTEAYLQGTLSAMTIGRQVIELRNALTRNQLPPHVIQIVQVVIRRMSRFTGLHGRTALTARSAVNILRREEIKQTNISTRLELTRVISCMIVIAYELDDNKAFLNPERRFRAKNEV